MQFFQNYTNSKVITLVYRWIRYQSKFYWHFWKQRW